MKKLVVVVLAVALLGCESREEQELRVTEACTAECKKNQASDLGTCITLCKGMAAVQAQQRANSAMNGAAVGYMLGSGAARRGR